LLSYFTLEALNYKRSCLVQMVRDVWAQRLLPNFPFSPKRTVSFLDFTTTQDGLPAYRLPTLWTRRYLPQAGSAFARLQPKPQRQKLPAAHNEDQQQISSEQSIEHNSPLQT
jgi:hypothetical protein